jgi:predicted metal-dependent hydrolase
MAPGVTGPLNIRRHPKAQPVADPASDPRLDEGIRLFNEGHHWHAHEAWEPLWMGLEGDDKLFLQGLIMAAAMLHQHEGRVERGVANHWANVQARLAHQPRGKWGVDVDDLLRQLERYAADAGSWRLDARKVHLARAKGARA